MRTKVTVAVRGVAFVFYAVTIGWRGILLIGSGDGPAAVGLGVGVLLLPVVSAWAVAIELRFGLASERLARELDAEGGLVLDDLPRRPSGRVDRAAADAAFEPLRRQTEQSPRDWRSWYRLATAYDAAGDRRRARAAVRRAIALHDGRAADVQGPHERTSD